MSQIWLNGVLSDQIDILDRGLQYGDGLFETMRISDGHVQLWDAHWQRLANGCDRLNIPLPGRRIVEKEIQQAIEQQKDGALKLIITRGKGERGYAIPAVCEPSRILMLNNMPAYADDFYSKGVRIYPCQTRLGINPALAGIKHLNRLEQVLARSEWSSNEYQEGLLCDIDDYVIEGTMSNIFWYKQACLYTPELTRCGVAGVMRETVMQLATQNAISIKMGLWPESELLDAEEIFITNSLIGIWPVSYILNKSYQVGPVTQQLQSLLQAKYGI